MEEFLKLWACYQDQALQKLLWFLNHIKRDKLYKNIIASSVLHIGIILIATMSLPFITKKPIELPPIISVELIQIMDKTNIPYAPKAKKIIEDVKKKEEEKD